MAVHPPQQHHSTPQLIADNNDDNIINIDNNNNSDVVVSADADDSARRVYLSEWGIPDEVLTVYRKAGLERLYPWQAECLARPGVSNSFRNLVYCAPTSGGKSLVSEVLLLRRLAALPGCMAMVVLPYVSLCQERARGLERLLQPLGVPLRHFYGGRGGALPAAGGKGGVIIATPEKANSLVSKLVEEDVASR